MAVHGVDNKALQNEALLLIAKGECVVIGVGAGDLGSTDSQFKDLALLQKTFRTSLTVFCFDLSAYPELSNVWPTSHIPTVLVFDGGKEVLRFDGGVELEALMAKVSYSAKSCT
jgi:hypothetical protein